MSDILNIKIDDIDSFNNHPFQVNVDENLEKLMNSIKNNGLINPIIVRKKQNGRYELISGHRRKKAYELLGLTDINAYIKDLSDDEATIYMVDSNMYREKILPSEKAYAYKMKLDAIKHQGKKIKTSETEVRKLESAGKISNESAQNIRRYVRLTYLIPELLKLVDATVKYDNRTYLTMGIKPAVELSYLSREEQKLVYSTIRYEDITPSHCQSKQIRELSKGKNLNINTLKDIFKQKKGNQLEQISFNKDKIMKSLPIEMRGRDKRYIEKYIIDAIVNYRKTKREELEHIKINGELVI